VIKGISVVYLHSAHGDKLANWYSAKLGLPVKATFPGWTEFDVGDRGSRFAIDHIDFPSSVVQRQAVMISFEVDDIHAAVKELSARGVRFHPSVETTVFDVGPSLVATLQDPAGNWVQLNEIKPAG
jgi:hypothetical protein